jgi:hypothetical protein
MLQQLVPLSTVELNDVSAVPARFVKDACMQAHITKAHYFSVYSHTDLSVAVYADQGLSAHLNMLPCAAKVSLLASQCTSNIRVYTGHEWLYICNVICME